MIGNKNLDSLILNYLADLDIFQVFLTGKYGKELSNYEPFWYNRLQIKFPHYLSLKPHDIFKFSKKHYTYLIREISKILKSLKIEDRKNISQDSLKNLSQKNKNYALYRTSRWGHLELVKYLVENGADIYADDVLSEASEMGHLEIVKYLVENGADDDEEINQALSLASKGGHLELVKYLVEIGADIHAHKNWALRLASENGHLEVVKYLVQNGTVEWGTFSLRWASKNGHLEVVKYLIQNGANIHLDDGALRYAVKNKHSELVEFLVQNGASIDPKNDEWDEKMTTIFI